MREFAAPPPAFQKTGERAHLVPSATEAGGPLDPGLADPEDGDAVLHALHPAGLERAVGGDRKGRMALPEKFLREVVDELGAGLGTGEVVDDEKSDSHGVWG
jgi:hypothetical protein